ncbi:hypothetical protein PENTCL1PPCAC_30075, partial [Pristionchus entomophagus]
SPTISLPVSTFPPERASEGMALSLYMLLLLAATACVALAQGPKTCSLDDLQECQNAFNSALGINEPQPWKDSNSYRSKVEAIYEQPAGNSGVRKVCRYFRPFKACLGPCYQQTVQVPFLVKNAGVAPTEATTYMATFNSMHYLCGAGFGTYIANPACFISSWKTARPNLDSVRNTFEAQAYLHPEQACSLATNVLTQFERAFQSGCGVESKDTQFWGCEYARTGIFTGNPQCTLSCS